MQTETATGAGGEQTDRLLSSTDSHGDHIRGVLRGRKDHADMGAPLKKSMSPEKQRIAIAEACGWRFEKWVEPSGTEYELWTLNGSAQPEPNIPDYLNDLSAMSDAVAYIQDRKNEYGQWLIAILTHDWPQEDVENVQKLVNAICTSTAEQWAEAFLRTIGKWTEE